MLACTQKSNGTLNDMAKGPGVGGNGGSGGSGGGAAGSGGSGGGAAGSGGSGGGAAGSGGSGGGGAGSGGSGGGNMSGGDMSANAGGADMTSMGTTPDMPPLQPYDWLQFGFDEQHSSNNTREATISKANVATLVLKQQMSFPSLVDGAPVYLSNVTTKNGVQDLLFIATASADIYALDAKTLTQVWMKSHPPSGACTSSNGGGCYTTAEPAIDPNRQFVYAYGLDGNIHKHAVADGTETMTGGWPQVASLKPDLEKCSSDLAIASSKGGHFLYAAAAGYPGDKGDYQGHLTVIKLEDGSQKVFNALCSNQTIHFSTAAASDCANATKTAVWSRPGVIYRPDDDRIYFSTGNGNYDGVNNWGDSMLAINADGTGMAAGPLDSWTPTDQGPLSTADADVGSTGPAFLPVPANSKHPHIALQGNKKFNNTSPLRIIDLDNMSGKGTPGNTGGELFAMNLPQGGYVLTQPAVWVNPADQSTWAFIANGSGISALKVVTDGGTGTPSLMTMWTKTQAGSSPVIANNILFYVGTGSGRSGANTVYAIDPTTGTGTVLWSAPIKPLTGTATIGGIHWESVIVVHGTVYVASENGNSSTNVADGTGYLSAFALP
jgi:hypothetical protein